jgi:hypothetical protein
MTDYGFEISRILDFFLGLVNLKQFFLQDWFWFSIFD